MKSTLGLALAAGVVIAFAVAWRLATREGASFLEQQWLFFAALPYNVTIVSIFGDSTFSPDAPSQVFAAATTEAAFTYVVGALVQGTGRRLWRAVSARA